MFATFFTAMMAHDFAAAFALFMSDAWDWE